MNIQRPLFWHQGLFLQPQHFQLQDQAIQSGLIPFLKYQVPHFWGVGALEIDHGALETGSFVVSSGSFLFPDGSYVDIPGNGMVAARRLEGLLVEGKPARLLVGLRRWNKAGENVTVVEGSAETASASTRFVTTSSHEEIRDLHGGGPDGQVRRLHYLLKVFGEGELDQLGEYLLIPVAKVEESGGIRLSRRFVPPSLSLEASEALSGVVKEIRDTLVARSLHLERYKKQRGDAPDPGRSDLNGLLALMALHRYVPQLHHLTQSHPVHPWVIYGVLQQLVGELASFSSTLDSVAIDGPSRLLRPYDHSDLWECFSTAANLVTQLLDELLAGPDHVVKLENDGTYFTADLKPAQLAAKSRYYLALTTAEESDVVCKLVEAVAKLSVREHLPLLTSHALPGIAVQYLQIPPQELPRRKETIFFQIDHHHKQWEMVTRSHNIALYWDSAPADLEVELMIVERP